MRARNLVYLILPMILSGCIMGEAQLQTQNSAIIIDSEDQSLVGFQKTVYRFAKTGTCLGCHASGQSPFFVNKDPLIARDALLSSGKVNFQRPELSRLYKRLVDDKHNCWGEGSLDENCKKNGEGMLEAIYAWREYVQGYSVDMGVVTAVQPFLPGSKLPLPRGAKLVEAEAAYSGSIVLKPDAPCRDAQNNLRTCKAASIGQRFKVSEDKVAGKGLYLYIPDSGRPRDALDIRMGNYAQYQFSSTEANYEIYMRAAAPINSTRSFDVQLNKQALGGAINIVGNGAWNWQRIGQFATSVGASNTFKVGIVNEGVKFDQILFIPDSFVYKGSSSDALANNGGVLINELIGRKVTLTFDLDPILDKAAADYNSLNQSTPIVPDNLNLVLDITVFDEEGYKVEKGTIVPKPNSPERGNNLLVRGVRFMINSSFNPNDSDWVTVNKVMPTLALDTQYANDADPKTISNPVTYRQLSLKPMLVQKQGGALKDEIAIAFETLDYTKLNPAGADDIPATLTDEETVKTMISTYCINCHSSFAADADRTQFVVKNAQFRLDPVKTFDWLFEGVQLPNEATPRPEAHVRRSHERMMRPPVRLPVAKGGGLAIGGGSEGSAIYRVWRYQERVPAEMQPYVEALSTGSPIADQLFDKFKRFIDGQRTDMNAPLFREEITDTVKPRLAMMGGIDDNVGNGSASFSIDFDAFDDVSRVEKINLDVQKFGATISNSSLDVFGDPNGAPMSNGSMGPNPRRFDGSFDFNTADFNPINLKTDNVKFVAQAEDESGNPSETLEINETALPTPRDNIQQTIGNCDVLLSPQGTDSNNAFPNNSLTVGVAVDLTAYAQNKFAAQVNGQNVETVMTVSENGQAITGAGAVASMALKASSPGTAKYTPMSTQNRTITVSAMNRIVGSNSQDPILTDPYSCTKSVNFSTTVTNTRAEVSGALEIKIVITSAFTGGISVTSLAERRINDATNYIIPVAQVVGTPDAFGNANRELIYRWPNTGRDGNDHTFTFSLDFGGRNITVQRTER